uniref:P-type Zn(2+) transporter n=1 Tax=Candidatus Kentrum sp. FW TaxID=2126338 RepID=A0A450TVC0_9GAMM|nr:MAG: cation-transporting P-type ATPase C [Candidatus Kentron sp. FW]
MFFQYVKKPLLQCDAIHSLPGRVRVGSRCLRHLGNESEAIRQRILDHPAVTHVAVSCLTENVLIHYDRNQTTADMVSFVEEVLGSFSLIALKAERESRARGTVRERKLQEEPISELISRVVVNAVTLLMVWLSRGRRATPTTLFGRLTTMPALTSLSLAGPILKSGVESLVTDRRPNADTLSSSAIIASLLAGKDVSALTIIFLADIAELLTAYTMDRTRRAIRDMLAVGEDIVWRLQEDGAEERVALDALRVDDRIMVHTGGKISVDGVVESGEAAVDQSSITGEFMPARKTIGDEVHAGTVVRGGRLVIRALKVGDDTAMARIVHLVEDATHRKAAVQTIADRISARFIPVNFTLAALVYAITGSSTRALNMLIIDYSCGVRLSTATALSAAICNAARSGILVKGGNYLEMLDETDTMVFDKTGTITQGRPEIVDIVSLEKVPDKHRLLALAAAAEESSAHPMAVAILDRVRREGGKIPAHSDTEAHAARGVSTRVAGARIRVGSRRFMQENGLELSGAEETVRRMAGHGRNIIYVARDDKLIGVLGLQDSLRENMKKALNRLRMSGVDDIILLTGDVEQHAEIVATRMGMDRFHAEVLPDKKADTVLRLQSGGAHVVMVGDGINDAPALAYADVGIAIGATRTDVAMEAADITITRDEPLLIPATVRLSRKTMSVVRQNFTTAIGVNTLGIVLASLGVLPVFWGAVLHNATTVAVVVNSSRLLIHDIEGAR